MRHDLLTMELLLAVAEARSITHGAKRLHLAVAAASKRILDVETRLGLRLFDRKARGAEPTAACRALLGHVRSVCSALDDFDAEAAQFSSGTRGDVRIVVAADAVVDGLMHNLAEFSRAHPEVHVAVSNASNAEAEEAVARGTADLAIFLRPAQGTPLKARPHSRGRWVALVPAEHALAGCRHVTFDDLLAFDIVSTEGPNVASELVTRAAEQLGVRVDSRLNASGAEATAALVEAGAGIALVMDVWAQRYCAMYRVDSVPLAEAWAEYEVVVGVAPQGKLPTAVQRLADALFAPRAVPLAPPRRRARSAEAAQALA